MASKIVLSRIPIPYRVWRLVGLFEHGKMDSTDYALDVFLSHHQRVERWLPDRYTLLELGPGDSIATALIAQAYGAARSYLVDAGAFASQSIELYSRLSARLKRQGRQGASFRECKTVSDILDAAGAAYLVNGLASLGSIPKDSVDFIFSHAVLEHIPLAEFTRTLQGLYEAQLPGGVSSHQIDLRDHLGESLHSLRFSPRLWESKIFSSSGFYTNRLRSGQIVRAFEDVGFEILQTEVESWETLPLARRNMHADFAQLPEDELLVHKLIILARKPG